MKLNVEVNEVIQNTDAIRLRLKEEFGIELPEKMPIFGGFITIEKGEENE